jgi:chromosome segregation ATPase
MRTLVFISIAALLFSSCNNSQEEQQLKALATRDSIMMVQAKQKDSTTDSYIHSLNEIQENMDSIIAKEHILNVNSGEGSPMTSTAKTLAEMKSLDRLIVHNNREIYRLEKKMKTSNQKNRDLEKLVARLTKELSEKNTQIVDLENKLAKANDSLKLVVHQLSDSIVVINRQRAEINAMRGEINTVYYAIGSMKELKSKGVATKEGGFIGLGRLEELKQDFNASYFTTANMEKLNAIALNAKFERLLTNHPSASYKISGNGKADSLLITNPASFWSTSKYLVVVVK